MREKMKEEKNRGRGSKKKSSAINTNTSNTTACYEDARRQRVEENKKRIQALGIIDVAKSLSTITTAAAAAEKKSRVIPLTLHHHHHQQLRLPKPKLETSQEKAFEPRRSSRARIPVVSYRDDYVDVDKDLLLPSRKRSRAYPSSWQRNAGRPMEECKTSTYEERRRALGAALELQTSLRSGKPSFVKSLVRSQVYSCYWFAVPTRFCKDHLPEDDLDMILEDENCREFETKYLANRTGISCGWRGFALYHKLDDGDAVVCELVEPKRFKVYIFRATSSSILSTEKRNEESSTGARGGKKLKKAKKEGKDELPKTQKTQQLQKRTTVLEGKPAAGDAGKQDKRTVQPRRKPPSRLLRKRV